VNTDGGGWVGGPVSDRAHANRRRRREGACGGCCAEAERGRNGERGVWPGSCEKETRGGLAGRHDTCGRSDQRMSHNAGENKGSGLMGRYGSAGVGLARRIVSLLFIPIISKRLELNQLKDELPVLQKLQIKYDFEDFEVRNNFPDWNFPKFELEFELKFEEALGFEIQQNLVEFE
jgi:hypothetical protein